jgi:hypothetical protein
LHVSLIYIYITKQSVETETNECPSVTDVDKERPYTSAIVRPAPFNPPPSRL